MTDKQIIEETLRYLSDESYNYAILIDGEWGCGKTYFVEHDLKEQIEKSEKQNQKNRKLKYISLYGCKSIEDMQENIVWELVGEARDYITQNSKKKFLSKENSDNVFLSSKKIGNALLKRFVPDVNTYDLIFDWLNMNSYIFIFDDIERCDCPLNEVFGFINGLVEHEGAKVILVANEKEITVYKSGGQKELQYSIVLNDNIEWPKKDTLFPYNYNRGTNQDRKITLKDLEEKRKLLFTDEEEDSLYRKIREKLIGVTLYYQPDIEKIAKSLIKSYNLDHYLEEILLKNVDRLCSLMNSLNHHNLRTYQFFLSKISYLYTRFDGIGIEEDYRKNALDFLIEDCFIWAAQFKGNIPEPTGYMEKAFYDARRKFLTTRIYVETGEFREAEFKDEVAKYIEDELKGKLPADDPFNLLYNEYYLHTQRWCEERLTEVKNKLRENKYPISIYTKILILLSNLIQLGFSKEYMEEIKDSMIKNISKIDTPVQLDDNLFYIGDEKRRQELHTMITEINQAVKMQDKQIKMVALGDILLDQNWVEYLISYTESNQYRLSVDSGIFDKAAANLWISAIVGSSAKDISEFRRWLEDHYPVNVRREHIKVDLSTMQEIAVGMEPEQEQDLIKRANLMWVKEHMERVLELYNNI